MAIGQILGGAAGLAVGGTQGMQIGSTLGGTIEGVIKTGQANKMTPPLVDPLQAQLYQDLERQKKQLESGTAYQAQQDVLKQAGLGSQLAATRMTGGDVGATINALRSINRSTGRNLNELYGSMNLEGLKVSAMMDTLAEKIATRRLGIQMAQQAQKRLEGTTALSFASQNLMNMGASSGKLGAGESGAEDGGLMSSINKLYKNVFQGGKTFGMETAPTAMTPAVTSKTMPVTAQTPTLAPSPYSQLGLPGNPVDVVGMGQPNLSSMFMDAPTSISSIGSTALPAAQYLPQLASLVAL